MRPREAPQLGCALSALILALLSVLLVAVPSAQADPVYPSKNEVKRARQHAGAVASRVSVLQAQLAAKVARADAAEVALSAAAEDFDTARIELADSQKAAQAAAAAARRARQRLAGAQQQVGELAAQTYRSGGALASLDVLLSPTGPEQVLERASMMHTLGAQRQHTVQKMDAARVVATILRAQAAQALARQTAAARRLELARIAAQQRAEAARAMVKTETAARNSLLVKLAAAQKTTVRVQRARQAGLAAAAAARRAAEQRRQAARAAARAAQQRAKTRSTSDSGGSSGSSDPSPPGPGSGSSSGSSSAGGRAVSWAEGKVGLPYQWGGAGPNSYDCSGLTMRAWAQAGVLLPHSARLQYSQVEKISYSELRPGDLVFYATDPSNPQTIHHVTMYVGGGQMVEAPYTGANVRVVGLRRVDSMPYAGRP
jgi:cell wall-associated NlpC family hydrolase